MSTVVKDLGAVSAYAYAVEKGYTGTEAEFAELMASYATVGQTAVTAAQTATTKASEAATSATTATNKAGEASQSASVAHTDAESAGQSASQAQTSAQTASTKASEASQSATTASTKASEATTAAGTATTAKNDAVAAKTAAETAQTAAETAQGAAEDAAESVSASAAQIATNTSDITELKSDLSAIETLLIGDGVSDVSLWENGSISGVGGNISNDARIRTKTYLWFGYSEGHLAVTCSSTYEMFFSAYDKDTKAHQGCIQTDMKIGTGAGAWLQSVNLIDYSDYVFRIVLRNKATPTDTMIVSYGQYVYFSGEKYGNVTDVTDLNSKKAYVYSSQAITISSGVYDKSNNFTNTGRHASVSVNAGEKYLITAKCYPSNDYPMYLFRKSGSVVGYKNIASAQFVLDEATIPDGADELIINSASSLIEVKKGTAVESKPYSKWQGKKIAWFGTSIPETSTYNAVLGYPEYVGKLLGATVYNESRGSSCARRGFKSAESANDPYGWTGMGYKQALYNMGSNHTEKQDLLDNWDSKWKALVGGDHTLTDGDRTLAMYYSYETVLQQHIDDPVDLYVFDHGYNDWSANSVNMEMNENDPYDRSTYQGAMNTFIKLILTANPRAKILLLSHYETQERPTLVPMQEAVAKYWNLPFCKICDSLGWANDRTVTTDGYWSNGTGNGIWIASGGTEQTYTLKQLHIPDGRHPNTDVSGHACIDIANIIADFINTMTPTD